MSDNNITNLTTDVEIKGTIKFEKIMNIDGKFEGELIADQGELIVGKTGTVKADVKVKNASIEGCLNGNIRAAEKVELKQNAQLIGDLQAKTLVIEEGVVFVGQCNVNPDGAKIEKQNTERQNIKVVKNTQQRESNIS
ncbi:MAG: polymer-forming cytoskeletal protein [Candidatus Brocadiaceae bacterium]|nr:polymer-forming cytoskeletal protein [Candidatus Brocadiaceae bacterium]